MHAQAAAAAGCRPAAAAAAAAAAAKGRGSHARRVSAIRPTHCRAPAVVTRASADPAAAALDFEDAVFSLPDAPVKALLPAGAWTVVEGGVCAPKGFKAAAFNAGLRATGTRADCALVVADKPAVAAGVFTLNRVAAAPVMYCRTALEASDTAVAVLINAGQANAATGTLGMEDSVASAAAVAAALGVDPADVLLESTGVIGKRIKMPELLRAIPTLATNLVSSGAAAAAAATAICTTDLVRKSIAIELTVGSGPEARQVRVGGMGKGSGMIHPNMATMLGVITCDAPVTPAAWRGMLRRAASNSFNQISVDGDTSTNDTVIGLASGAAGGEEIVEGSEEAAQLEAAVTAVCTGIAKSIAWDGEGATCLIEVNVEGAPSAAEARLIARTIVSSSLVKSAVFGHDPNWGRLACAAGYAGVPFEQEALRIAMGPHVLMEDGQPLDYDATAASMYLKDTTAVHGTVVVDVRVGPGEGGGTAWGCDLTYDYVKINAEYTT
uniref:Arginine biosynthesis bifunctional protein ArgJ, chloroplastic n=1 Tax=Mantoniella antarctica TaxID=81844 RepID=A0A7S0SQR8_9CHLO|mmetsp:Transcript_32916/g.83008  ORF Transcript_32916/g.83008 Transcript_32916/m.83008 type:complete len:496 (+) Transcript_32916:315-1802(+)